jgi:hypothetical protein
MSAMPATKTIAPKVSNTRQAFHNAKGGLRSGAASAQSMRSWSSRSPNIARLRLKGGAAPFSYATFRLRVAAAFFADRDRSSAGRLAEALPPR